MRRTATYLQRKVVNINCLGRCCDLPVKTWAAESVALRTIFKVGTKIRGDFIGNKFMVHKVGYSKELLCWGRIWGVLLYRHMVFLYLWRKSRRVDCSRHAAEGPSRGSGLYPEADRAGQAQAGLRAPRGSLPLSQPVNTVPSVSRHRLHSRPGASARDPAQTHQSQVRKHS